MKKTTRKVKRHLNYKLISFVFIIFSIITCFLVIKSGLFSLFNNIFICVIAFVIDLIIVKGINSKLKSWIKGILVFITFILLFVQIGFYIFAPKVLSFISSIYDDGTRTYVYSIYVLDKSEYKELKDLNNKMISYIKDDNTKKIHNELNKQIQFKSRISDDINKLMDGIKNEEVDAVLLEESYEDVIKEQDENSFNNLRKIYTFEIKTKIKLTKKNLDIVNKPFLIYISGIDTKGKISSNARSDVNLVMAINPETKEVVLVSTPRDFYVELPSKGKKDKLTHAGLYGINESMKSLSKLYDVDINYYLRINFTSFIDIIDTLGGIEVDIEGDFCESNEDRSTKKKDQICLKKGKHTLNGREALAYARNRHAFSNGDISRGNHQMQILEAILKKATTKDVLNKYGKIIDALKGKMLTNINIDDLYKIAKKQLKDNKEYHIESYTPIIKDMTSSKECYSLGDYANVLIGDDESINEISNKIKEVLK